MESSEQTGSYIYPPICTDKLIFCKGTFFILFFLLKYDYESYNFTNLNYRDVFFVIF